MNAEDEFTGEISAPFPLNFKIPHKSSTSTDNEPVNQINPMEYYSTEPAVALYPPKPPTDVVAKKRKLDDGAPRSFYRPPCDESLPIELNKLMLPLHCELCSVTLNSPITAKIHYEAKPHDKKVNAWLLEWSSRTGLPIPKRQKVAEGPSGPNAFHCELCDLPLTSLQHANQHYSGKRHRMALAGRSNPHGSGYYGPDGKWIRIQTKVAVDPTGRFNIGESFLNNHQQESESATSSTLVSTPSTIAPSTSSPSVETEPDKYCQICNVSVTSQPQMKLHLEGQKHAKKLKAIGAPPYTADGNDTILQCIDTKPTKGHLKKRDISIYRTPSGYFYCKPCDVTIPNEVLFNQHLDGKKHIKACSNAANVSK
ncbi:zinc finger matrin-type protein 3-like [Bradysia coprophila]|uniref:zinc finger matrin-type protein 3-like n=1 Tax=Bradysia coprophila TaxID=38358 RepID=UPI00187DC15C|nr:zinc finger matrin-type protein 3-like [Bradysia coprophila]